MHFDSGHQRPQFDGHELRDDQLYHVFAIANWCRNSEDEDLDPKDAVKIIRDHYNYTPKKIGAFPLFNNIRDPEHWLHKLIYPHIMQQNHKDFFEPKAHTSHAKASGKGMLGRSARKYEDVDYMWVDLCPSREDVTLIISIAALTQTLR